MKSWTTEEIEALARETLRPVSVEEAMLRDPDDEPIGTPFILARFILAALPVLRAAEAYRDAKDFDRYEATALEEAIDEWRGRK